ncbi:hypothetical protein AAG584_23370 [Vreelandella titanicae]|uniref:hypothetical protein n=1 Tax=Halomonadaceae TaxID=28256 RepID=UPI0012DA6AA8|nr:MULTISPECIES: hypothetical protein [unclassified Halomonas]NAO97256.1 hypothetical protein [Halomonas sp. MG34]QGQ70266.1 hypothetical protein FDY98_09815 [Halomonas sp. PA16-9]
MSFFIGDSGWTLYHYNTHHMRPPAQLKRPRFGSENHPGALCPAPGDPAPPQDKCHQPLVLERAYNHLGGFDHLTPAPRQQSYQYDALGRMSFRSLQGDPASKVIV